MVRRISCHSAADQAAAALDPVADIKPCALCSWLMTKKYMLGGSKITSLEASYDQASERLIPGTYWGQNLDAFNGILAEASAHLKGDLSVGGPIQKSLGQT
jgi:hypothetical protein